jgi:hypothetical protein
MGPFKKLLLTALLSCSLYSIDKDHVAYLMKSVKTKEALALYDTYKQEMGRHDFEILVRLSSIILEEGIQSADPVIQLCSLWGTAVAQMNSSLDILEQGIKSQNFETQVVAIQLLGQMQDDVGDELLSKAMSSPFLMARMEAGFHLALRKHRKACGQIESLMYRLPPEYGFYFPQLFALIGTPDAIEVLKNLMEDRFPMTRVAAILAAARFGRDDLSRRIRAHATHPHPSEQEAAAAALGELKDSKSIPLLKSLAKSSSATVKLSALFSLHLLGDLTTLDPICELAKQGDLFAISSLSHISDSEEVLFSLLQHQDIHVRFNAAYALLERRDPRCKEALVEFLLPHSKDLGFMPVSSMGQALTAWKIIPSLQQKADVVPFDLTALATHVREEMLSRALELPEKDFLFLAHQVFHHQQHSLIPHLVHLLENHATVPAILLLKKNADHAGSPLIRNYCNLALFKMKQEGPYETRLRTWILNAQTHEMVQFRPHLPWHLRKNHTTYELTPQESTRLLLEGYQALAGREEGIDILLNGLKYGHPNNRFALAGLLIQCLQ